MQRGREDLTEWRKLSRFRTLQKVPQCVYAVIGVSSGARHGNGCHANRLPHPTTQALLSRDRATAESILVPALVCR